MKPNHNAAGLPSTRPTNMQEPPLGRPEWTWTLTPQNRTPPPGTPFDEDFIPSTARRQQPADPSERIHTENYFAPLSEEQALAEAAASA